MGPIELPARLAQRLRAAERVVVFTGSGVSQESGIATFRDPGGVWQRFRPEEVATPEAFARDPARVWKWYVGRYRTMAGAEPNSAHRDIARWSELFPSVVVVTQNIDSLHERAGSPEVVELHGSLSRARCAECGEPVAMAEAVERPEEPPRCGCGGLLRPDVVWFGEILPQDAFGRAAEVTEACDLFVSVGTSASVYPAAGFIELALRRGAMVVEVNPEETPFSSLVDLRLAARAGEGVPELTRALAACRSAPT